MVAMIYRPAKLVPQGDAGVITLPVQVVLIIVGLGMLVLMGTKLDAALVRAFEAVVLKTSQAATEEGGGGVVPADRPAIVGGADERS